MRDETIRLVFPPRRTDVWPPAVTHDLLGMKLANPTPQILEYHRLWPQHRGPVVVSVADPSIFLMDDGESTAPSPGCMFLCVTFGGFQWSLGSAYRRKWLTPTARHLARQVLKRSLSPRAHQREIDLAGQRYLREAAAFPDEPWEQQWRILASQTMEIPRNDRRHHICGIVYGIPRMGGTMTTYLRLTRRHLGGIRAFLRR